MIPHDEDGVEVEVGSLAMMTSEGALGAVDRAAIDIQVSTAKQYPRSVDRSLKEAITLATLDEETAGSMIYALPRAGKTIEGPSARLAEVMAYSWGNLRADADIVAEDRTHITAMGTCFDLEKNVAIRVRVKRRITDKHGKKFNEDMISVASNAAISIALRNSVFKVIPRAFVDRIYAAARKASLGQGGTMAQKRQAAIEWFKKAGATESEVFERLGVRGLDDIGEDQLVTLRGLLNAIKEGETSIEAVFRPAKHSEATSDLNDALKKSGASPAATAEAEKDDSPATPQQVKQLRGLLPKAREAGLLDMANEESVAKALSENDGPVVREWVRELNVRLARAAQGAEASA